MRTPNSWTRLILLAAIAVLAHSGDANAQTFLNPGTTYSSAADSPFADLIAGGGVFVEDFEDLALEPGVTETSGVGFPIGPSAQTDSVDGDDGTLGDGGTGGSSYFSDFPDGTSTFRFVFDGPTLGGLPTHVGIVWTDVGNNDVTGVDGIGVVTFEAFDSVGISLGTTDIDPIGDGSTFGETAEDRFLGVIHFGGVSAIELSMDADDWEADHLQYGTPEPASAILLATGLTLLNLRRRSNA